MRIHTSSTVAALLAITLFTSTPRITGIGPAAITPAPAAQLVTVSGEAFLKGLSLAITSPAGGTQLFKDADIQALEESSFRVSPVFSTAGTYSLVVTNPDGGVSQPFQLKVAAVAPAVTGTPPVIDAVTPSRAQKQTQAQLLRVDGKRFAQGLVVNVTDPTGVTVNVSGSAIGQQTPNTFNVSVVLSIEGEYSITVTNADGQISNMVSVSVR
jgi:hypothetical protein